ncbi:SelT/SelW/SelH family protein [Rhodococcus sp. SGAir0479]|uniref:SelT/SelW/SelH family protein n=1 Tax=Rhodococcus sp. SGAir0479 TaxID=2567884 RepID=UPI0010CD22C2|nr:SelT/SelW/SelH family protein [Rhodococcus sp. SGAir0479]QCQ89765.1 SelT/SelW/SelH family protein [Rhodococcus sp. SGAir0479]
MTAAARVTITYCTQCNWLLRAGWMAQELLNTFGTDLAEVALIPGTGGVFRIGVGDTLVWDRKRDGGFPDIVTLKKLIRDAAVPGRDLGHADRTRDH